MKKIIVCNGWWKLSCRVIIISRFGSHILWTWISTFFWLFPLGMIFLDLRTQSTWRWALFLSATNTLEYFEHARQEWLLVLTNKCVAVHLELGNVTGLWTHVGCGYGSPGVWVWVCLENPRVNLHPCDRSARVWWVCQPASQLYSIHCFFEQWSFCFLLEPLCQCHPIIYNVHWP